MINSNQIDLQDILTNPFYFLGNVQLVEFAGQGIFRWFRKSDAEKDIEFIERLVPVSPDKELADKFTGILESGEISISGLHYAVVLLQSEIIK